MIHSVGSDGCSSPPLLVYSSNETTQRLLEVRRCRIQKVTLKQTGYLSREKVFVVNSGQIGNVQFHKHVEKGQTFVPSGGGFFPCVDLHMHANSL